MIKKNEKKKKKNQLSHQKYVLRSDQRPYFHRSAHCVMTANKERFQIKLHKFKILVKKQLFRIILIEGGGAGVRVIVSGIAFTTVPFLQINF